MHNTDLDRRKWLQSVGLTLTGLAIAPALSSAKSTKPIHNPFTGQWIYEFEEAEVKARLWRNENPFGPSDKAKAALKAALPESNRYAFEMIRALEQQIANYHGLNQENVMITAGSSEILILAGIAFGSGSGSILSSYPTFNTLMNTAGEIGGNWQQVPLDISGAQDLKAMETAINRDTDLVYICNPNNPTGTLLDQSSLNTFAREVSGRVPVFVDEAYTEFLDDPEKHTVIPLIREGHDLIVAKTFSKIHGFAGLRIGYALGTPDSIERIRKYQRWPVTPTGPSVSAAMASLEDTDFMRFCRDKNTEAKEFTYSTLSDKGMKYIPSYTSFVLFQIPEPPSECIQKMQARGVGVRGWSFADKHWCRVSMGTMDEMQMFADALNSIY